MSTPIDLKVASDAAGSLGFEAYLQGLGAWFLCQAQQSIAYKDLFPVVVAPFTWGPQWFRKHIMFYSDNEAVVHMLTSKGPL